MLFSNAISMPAKNLTTVWKVLIVIFITGTALLIAGRDHFFLGTALILFRWIFFSIGLFFLYFTYKRITPKPFKVGLLVILAAITLEYTWNRINEKSLTKGPLTTEVSVMTYNLFFKNQLSITSIDNIKNCNPDILLVQELTPEWKNKLESAVGSSYPYKVTYPLKGSHGFGIYSRFPILTSELLRNKRNLPFAQLLELDINNKKVQLINTHLASPAMAVEHPDNFINFYSSNYNVRSRQLDTIHTIANKREKEFHAQLLIGDLNTTTHEPIYRNIKSEWVNLYDIAGSGLGLSFPNSLNCIPLLTIDYMFGKGNIQGIEMKVIPGGGSDHLAIAGKIKL